MKKTSSFLRVLPLGNVGSLYSFSCFIWENERKERFPMPGYKLESAAPVTSSSNYYKNSQFKKMDAKNKAAPTNPGEAIVQKAIQDVNTIHPAENKRTITPSNEELASATARAAQERQATEAQVARDEKVKARNYHPPKKAEEEKSPEKKSGGGSKVDYRA